jgi:hypothetical protein
MAERQTATAAAPPADQHLRMGEAIAIGMKGATAAESGTKEKLKCLAACGLNEGEWDQVPLICVKMTEDGRTRSAVRDGVGQEHQTTNAVTGGRAAMPLKAAKVESCPAWCPPPLDCSESATPSHGGGRQASHNNHPC